MAVGATPQIPRNLPLLTERSPAWGQDYGPRMARSAMVKFLALAAKQMREEHDRRRYEVSSSATDRVDPSTLYRFEKGRWPENADRVIDLYAADLGVDPIEIWCRALEMWRADAGARSAEGDGHGGHG